MRDSACRLVVSVLVAGLLLPVEGCNRGISAVDDPQQARDALTKALDTWQAGGRAESLRQQTPEIVVGDWQWSQGQRLVDYEIGRALTPVGETLRVPVTLTLQKPSGEKPKKLDAVYVIVFDRVITIIREFE